MTYSDYKNINYLMFDSDLPELPENLVYVYNMTDLTVTIEPREYHVYDVENNWEHTVQLDYDSHVSIRDPNTNKELYIIIH